LQRAGGRLARVVELAKLGKVVKLGKVGQVAHLNVAGEWQENLQENLGPICRGGKRIPDQSGFSPSCHLAQRLEIAAHERRLAQPSTFNL